jgi:transcriptional regulator with XRE-family HTH domain
MGKVPYERYDAAYTVFTQRLRAARIARGLTQAQAAALVGKAQPWLSRCESGERRVDGIEIALFEIAYNQPPGSFTEGALRSRPRRKRPRG